MRITFDRDFDAGAWPGALQDRSAVVGEAWVGELGLLDLLETTLGLGAPWEGEMARAAALVPAVLATRGFWSRSATLDPLGTAGRLLAWRDELRLHGWRGEADAGRLGALARVTAAALPGLPDRWEQIEAALGRRKPGVESIRLFEDPGELPVAIRRVIERLVAQGAALRIEPPPVAEAPGDLGRARRGRFVAEGDGTLQLLRPHGPLQAAEDVAAWLAARGDCADTVIVGAEPLLDAALARHGLPTTGSTGQPADNALLQVLPLVLALGWDTPDPQRALELLMLPQGPVPPSIARRLAAALHEHPAVGSDRWNEALMAGLEAIEDPERREKIRDRLAAIFAGSVARCAGYEAREVSRRVELVQQWLHRRRATADDPAPWSAAIAQCATLGRLVQLSGLSQLPESMLHRFVEEASRAAGGLPLRRAQAGIASVAAPGAVAGPVRRVVWWNFTRSAAERAATIPLAREEREALAAAGVELPTAAALAMQEARRWQRPLQAAKDEILFVCPERDAAGKEAHPHPLWDEILAAAKEAHRLVRRAPEAVPRRRREPLEAIAPRRFWNLPAGTVGARPVESPSSLGTLVGCSFAWALQYAAKVSTGAAAALPQAEKLAGTAVHAILAELLQGPERTPDEAAEAARRLFAEKGPKLAAALFLPGADGARAQALRATEEAARELFRLFRNGRFRVASVEKPYRKRALGTELEGTPDLVVEGPGGARFPVDLKWSGASYRRGSLEDGSAFQLAAYSYLVGEEGEELQNGAYFILTDQRLITCRDDIAGVPTANGPNAATSWTAAAVAHGERLAELQQGRAVAAAIEDEDGEGVVEKAGIDEEGRLVLGAPCRFCDYAALCGLTFGGK